MSSSGDFIHIEFDDNNILSSLFGVNDINIKHPVVSEYSNCCNGSSNDGIEPIQICQTNKNPNTTHLAITNVFD